MALTDADLAAAGGVVDDSAPVRVRAPKGTPGKPARVKDVPLTQAAYGEQPLAAVRTRVGALGAALGLDPTTEGIVLDHDASNYLLEGHDPDVIKAVRSQYGYDTKKTSKESDKSAISNFFTGDPHAEGETFPEFNSRWGGLIPQDDDRKEESQKAYDKARLFITKRAEGESPVPEDIGKYLISRSDSKEKKAYTRGLIADRLEEEARSLPAQGGGTELAAQIRQAAKYVRTLDPALLADKSHAHEIVNDLTKHASPPVRRAIKTSLTDALLGGFGNNVAPLTMGLGSMIAKAPGLVAPGGGDTLDPADIAGGGGAADAVPRETPVGLPGTRAASGTVGQNVEMMHQAVVEGLTGKSPEEQAAFIDQLKREHPVAYHAAAAAGWLADPVGLLGGKAVQGLRAAGRAAGLGAMATPAALAAVGAPTGIVAGRAAGSENDLLNAGLGVAGEAAGAAVGAGLGKVAGLASRAPARLAQEEVNQSARVIAHDLGQLETRHGIKGQGTGWEQIYEKLRKQYPDLPATLAQKADPLTGRARPNLVPELAHAADVVSAGHAGTPTAGSAALHPMVTLSNPNATAPQLARDFAHEAMLHGPVRPGMMVLTGQAGAVKNVVDKGVAKLVTAIRGGRLDEFQAAIRAAHADGLSPAMIDAATEAFHRRNKGHR